MSVDANSSGAATRNAQQGLDRLELLEPVSSEKRVHLQFRDVAAWVPAFVTPPSLLQRWKSWLQRPKGKDKPPPKPKEKQILHGLSGSCEPGEVFALMGPSGSGKTSLLTILGGRAQKSMRRGGEVVYNGQQMTKGLRRHVGFVLQDDLLYETLTVFETLYYAAMLRLPGAMPTSDKVERVDKVIRALGLDSCRNTIVGGFFRKGISGGERKRCSIGHELLINPSLLFLDEPTSGLDSTVSMHVLSILGKLAKGGRAVVTTIHQPSARLYLQLDKLLLLSKGHMVYYGTASLVVTWFDALGYPLPYMMNVADFFLDLASGEVDAASRSGEATRQHLIQAAHAFMASHPQQGFTSPHQIVGLSGFAAPQPKKAEAPLLTSSSGSDGFTSPPTGSAASPADTDAQEELQSVPSTSQDGRKLDEEDGQKMAALGVEGGNVGTGFSDKGQRWGASYGMQFAILFQRAVKTRRFQSLSLQDFCLYIAVGVLSGLFWWQRGQGDNVMNAMDTLGLLFFELMFLAFRTLLAALFTFPQEYKMMLKERASGMYRLSAFYFARVASDLPLDMVIPMIFVIIIYFMGGLRRTGAGYIFANLGTVVLAMFVSQSWGLLLGVAVIDPKTAQTIASVVVLAFVLVGGYFVRNIPSWISWLKYTSFIYYAYGLLLRIEFKGRTLYQCHGAEDNCVNVDVPDPEQHPQQCTPVPGGYHEALNLNQNPDSEGQLFLDIFVLLGMLVALRVLTYMVLRKKTAQR